MKLANESLEFAKFLVVCAFFGGCMGLLVAVANNTKSAAGDLSDISQTLKSIEDRLERMERK